MKFLTDYTRWCWAYCQISERTFALWVAAGGRVCKPRKR